MNNFILIDWTFRELFPLILVLPLLISIAFVIIEKWIIELAVWKSGGYVTKKGEIVFKTIL